MTAGELSEPASGSALALLQEWYSSQCDGEWEHSYGVKIDALDNPGWVVKIDVPGLTCPEVTAKEMTMEAAAGDWMRCFVKDAVFHGYGDPFKLETILTYFLKEIAPASGRST